MHPITFITAASASCDEAIISSLPSSQLTVHSMVNVLSDAVTEHDGGTSEVRKLPVIGSIFLSFVMIY